MRDQAGEKGETEEGESQGGHRESSCEAEPGRKGKAEQRLSSQNPKLRRTKECQNSGGQKAERKQRKLWNGRPREGWKRKRKTRVNRKKHLQRLKPAEDEMKLQTKLFARQCVEAERRKPPLDESG